MPKRSRTAPRAFTIYIRLSLLLDAGMSGYPRSPMPISIIIYDYNIYIRFKRREGMMKLIIQRPWHAHAAKNIHHLCRAAALLTGVTIRLSMPVLGL